MITSNTMCDAQLQGSSTATESRKHKRQKQSKRRTSFSPDSTSQPALTSRQKQKRRSIDRQSSRLDRERQSSALKGTWGEEASTSSLIDTTSFDKLQQDRQFFDLEHIDYGEPSSQNDGHDDREGSHRDQKHQQQQRDKRRYTHRASNGALRTPNSPTRKKHGKNRNKPHPFDGFTPAELKGDEDSDDDAGEVVFTRLPARSSQRAHNARPSADLSTQAGTAIRKLVLRLPSSHNPRQSLQGHRSVHSVEVAGRRFSTSSLSSIGSGNLTRELRNNESDEENARFGDIDPSDVSEDSDSSSMTLSEDDVQSEDIEGEEERFLIADTLRELDEKLRTRIKSPGNAHDRVQPPSVLQSEHDTQKNPSPRPFTGSDALRRVVTDATSNTNTIDAAKIALTWSDGDASESRDLSEDDRDAHLDALLGLTQQDSAIILGRETWSSDDDRTMRFEDFLGEDDGDDISNADDEVSRGDGPEAAQSATSLGSEWQSSLVQDKHQDEHLRTDADVASQGGFVFFRPDSAEPEDHAIVNGADDRSGDTTDTLDDTDHLGLVRFGIESADEDDEAIEQALASARRDRSLVDARNLGLSLSIEDLASNPEAVVAETARSLRIPPSMAARILASIGMTLLLGHDDDGIACTVPLDGSASDADSTQPRASTVRTPSRSAIQSRKRNHEPVMGTFAPAGSVELCVVVAPQANRPVPSPFSARKRRRISQSQLGFGSAHRSRGDSASAASAVSAHSGYGDRSPSSSTPELVECEIYLDLDDLVDDSELPIEQASSSEMDDDYDDGMSVSTATAELVQVLGDTSRWRNVPIGAFRSQREQILPSLSRLPPGQSQQSSLRADTLTLFPPAPSLRSPHARRIPVSPVLLPMYRGAKSLKAVSGAKSRKDRRRERQLGQRRLVKPIAKRTVHKDRKSFHNTVQMDSITYLTSSLPSEGLRTGASPLFPGLATTTSTENIPSFILA